MSNTTDMTRGTPAVLILKFAAPLLIGNIFQQIYSVVDTMICGYNLGEPAIAAIGTTSALYFLVIDTAVGMNNGYAIVVAKCFGAHSDRQINRSIAGMILLNGVITAILTILSLIFLKPLLMLMNTPETIFYQAYSYIAIIFGGLFSTVIYNMCAGILRALGNSKIPLYFLVLSTVLNIILDAVVIIGFHTGVGGAAAATVTAEIVSAALLGWYIFKNYRAVLPTKQDFMQVGEIIPELFFSGFAMAVMLVVLDIGSIFFQSANNRLGESVIAAYTASRRIIMIMMQPISTITTAASTFVSQNLGGAKYDRIKRGVRQMLLMETAWSVFSCFLILVFGGYIIVFSTGIGEADMLSEAVLSLRIHFSCFLPLGILMGLRTTLLAMGKKSVPVLASSLELLIKILGALWLIPEFGYLGTCITEPLSWCICTLFLLMVYLFLRNRGLYEPPK